MLALLPGQSQPSARLNRAGALVTDFTLARLPERGQPFSTFLIIIDRALAAALTEDLRQHVVTEDVLIDDVSEDFDGWLILGPQATTALAAVTAGSPAPAETWSTDLPLTGDPGFLLLQRHGARPALGPAVAAAAAMKGLIPWPDDTLGQQAWHWLCLEAGHLRPASTICPAAGRWPRPDWNRRWSA